MKIETDDGSATRRARRRTRLWPLALAMLAGCATPTTNQTWQLKPAWQVRHGSDTAAAEGYAALARQYDGENRSADALAAWRRAHREAPDDVDILNRLAMAEALRGDAARAVELLTRAVGLAPGRAPLLNNLGYALLLDGRPADAASSFREALQADPMSTRALENLSIAREIASRADAVAQRHDDAPPAAPVQAAVKSSAEEVPPTEIAAAPPAAPTRLAARTEISNGNGVPGMAAWVDAWLRRRGLENRSRLTNLLPYRTPTTIVEYRDGFADIARELAIRMPAGVAVTATLSNSARSDVRVVIGHDLRERMKQPAEAPDL